MKTAEEETIKETFIAILGAIEPLSDEAKSSLKNLLFIRRLNRQEYLIREGDTARYANYLADGIVRVYYSDDRTEYNKTFFTEHTFPTPLTALLTGEPSQLYFQALTPCIMLSFDFQQFKALSGQHRVFEQLVLRILEKEWTKKERHDIRMVTNDAATNYRIFREEYPGLEQKIPQYHVASYLGVTPIQLSRIRSNKGRT
ncbi:MAG: Crp/Fnr family transcriptional regulator [Bacteroidota bacterium]